MKYSLSNYILTVKTNDSALYSIFKELSIGGEGSLVDSMSISLNSSLFTTTGFPTGGWVHDKNLDRTGTASVTLSQLSNNVDKLKQLMNAYYSGDYDGLTLTITDANANEVVSCEDCFPSKFPDQQYQSKAQTQTWSFTCGKITIK